MTLREKICASEIGTLREYLCLEGEGGGVIVNSEMIYLSGEEDIGLVEVSDVVSITEEEELLIELTDEVIEISIDEGDEIDGIC